MRQMKEMWKNVLLNGAESDSMTFVMHFHSESDVTLLFYQLYHFFFKFKIQIELRNWNTLFVLLICFVVVAADVVCVPIE